MKGESVNILSQTLRTGDRIIGVCSGSSGNSSMTLGASFPCLFYTVKQRFSETLGALQLWGVCGFQGGHCRILLDTDVWDCSRTIMGSTLWSRGVTIPFQPDSHEEFHWELTFSVLFGSPALGDNSLPAVNYLCSPRPAASPVSPFWYNWPVTAASPPLFLPQAISLTQDFPVTRNSLVHCQLPSSQLSTPF